LASSAQAAIDVSRLLDERAISPVQWLVVVLSAFVMLVDGYDVAVMSLSVPLVSHEWGIAPQRFSAALSAVLLGLTVGAAFLAGVIARRRLRSPLAQETVSAVVGLAPAVVSLRTSRAAAWHAVEHKSIAAYEAAGLDEVDRASAYPKEHPRCGSNLVVPMMVATVATNLLLRALPTDRRPGTRTVAGALAIGMAVEVFAFATRHPEHPVARGIHGIGHAIQALVATREPEDAELLVGAAALREICRVEGIAADSAA